MEVLDFIALFLGGACRVVLAPLLVCGAFLTLDAGDGFGDGLTTRPVLSVRLVEDSPIFGAGLVPEVLTSGSGLAASADVPV